MGFPDCCVLGLGIGDGGSVNVACLAVLVMMLDCLGQWRSELQLGKNSAVNGG